VNAVRGLTKPFGYRVPACSTAAFSKRCRTELPADVLSIVEPLLLQIEQLTAQIEAADQRIDDLAESPTPKRWHQQEYPA
jgi:transposase